MRVIPSPWQASHRPPFTLKLNRPGLNPRSAAPGVWVKSSRMGPNAPV